MFQQERYVLYKHDKIGMNRILKVNIVFLIFANL